MNYISIHHTTPITGSIYYIKDNKHTYEEYSKLVHSKQLIKDVVLIAVLGVVVALRAYVWFAYGI